VYFANRRGEPVAVYWLPDDGSPRKQVGFVAPRSRLSLNTTLGHKFLLKAVRSGFRREFTVERPGQTCVLKSAVGNAGGKQPGAELQPPDFKVTVPPPELGLGAVYTKFTSVSGYPIVACSNVNDYALKEAAHLVAMMMSRRPDALDMMTASGSRLCILGYNQYTTDLPEFAQFKPKDYWDARARGTGGSQTDPYCSCGEENLLGYPGDPYSTECILIHEFAHNIHLRGLVNLDTTFDRRLKDAYEAAMKEGLWAGKYASVNHHEYFAEGVQSWFGNNRENDHDHNHVNTREELIEYDPRLAAICREVFGDTELVYTKPVTRLHGHLAGYDPSGAPRFVWPDRLKTTQKEIRRKARERNAAARKKEKMK